MARGVFRQNSGSSSNEVSPSGFYDHSKSLALSSEWQKHSITYTMPSISLGSGIKGFFLSFRTTDGTSLDAPSSSASIYITGVQLELGKVATPFEHRSYGEELALCQRYYFKEGYRQYQRYGTGFAYSTTGAAIVVHLPTAMRATPAISTSGASTLGLNYGADTVNALSNISINTGGSSEKIVAVSPVVASGLTTGQAVLLINNNNTNAYMAFDAEL